MIVEITGTPGTGKTTLAKLLSKMTGWKIVSSNDVVREKKLWSRKERGSLVADIGGLSKALSVLCKNEKGLILEGHLLCEMGLRADFFVVLRTRPGVLRKRLEARGYPKAKVEENVLAEALDYCTIESERRHKVVYEIDTGGSPKSSLAKLKKIIAGKGKAYLSGKVNWKKDLEALASGGR